MSSTQLVMHEPRHDVSVAKPNSQVLSPSPAVQPPIRLRLSPSIGKGALDGAWWPHSRDLTVEAVDLADQFPAWFDRVCRVVYSTPDWETTRRRVKAARVFVGLGSFPRDDTHLVMVKSVASAYRPGVLRLLVVPPEWGEQTARHAMRIAATPTNVKSAATILSESVDLLLAGLLWHWDDDGGANVTA